MNSDRFLILLVGGAAVLLVAYLMDRRDKRGRL